MTRTVFALAAAATCALACAASADFTGVETDVTVNINGTGLTQYRIYAAFDAPDDRFLTWGGYVWPGYDFILQTNAPSGFNQTGSAIDPVWGWDVANAYTLMNPEGETDTWLGMDDNGFASPGFLDDLGGHAGALEYVRLADGGIISENGPYNIGVGRIIIANLVVEDGYGVRLSGAIGWDHDGGAPNGEVTDFYISTIPAPAAFSLLTLASLAASRRRRT
jgi:hypothetical protein